MEPGSSNYTLLPNSAATFPAESTLTGVVEGSVSPRRYSISQETLSPQPTGDLPVIETFLSPSTTPDSLPIRDLPRESGPQGRTWGAAMQGQRANEDTFAVKRLGNNLRYFAVFDGHGAPNQRDSTHVAQYAKEHLHQYIAERLSEVSPDDTAAVKVALEQAVLDLDRDMAESNYQAGSTATIIIIDDARNLIYQINLGDSRSIIYSPLSGTIISQTTDHTPTIPSERSRIEQSGSFVSNGRVNGSLAVSRALGDFEYKITPSADYDPQGPVSAVPTITTVPKTADQEILLTSDAPFESNAYTNESLVDLARLFSSQHEPTNSSRSENIAQSMIQSIVPNTTDDTTIIHVVV